MDQFRKVLDELMGADRDLPMKEKVRLNKHFDNNEVCKFSLLDFCPNDLFPNSKPDLGTCRKKHDQFYKIQFNTDPNKEKYQIKYEELLMDFLEDMIADVDSKMKKSFERIEAPLPDTEKPKELMENIQLIDIQIQKLIEQAERLGEQGRIDESEAMMRNIERLREQKNDLMIMSEHPLMLKEKQMKVCEVCGAMQSLQDNEKRQQTHIEGKQHTGYLKIREYLDLLRRRKLDRKYRADEERVRETFRKEMKEKELLREKDNGSNKTKNR